MNYGKKSTDKKRKSLTSRSSMMGKRVNVSFLRVLFAALITLCIAGGCAGVGAIRGIIANAPDVSEINIQPLGAATFVYDDQGNQLQKLTAPTSNRLPVSIDQIPVDLQHAVVAIEDERFYEHNGIDVRGIIRAAVKGIASGGNFSEGASTITQQLLKNNVFTDWTSESTMFEKLSRKFQEQYLAIQVEKVTDKDTILENYLNTINLGAGSYGVQAASQRYFGKDVWDLNLSECVTLAGITQNPTRYNPITNPEDNAARRKEVLDHMLTQNYITQEQYDECMADDVYSRIVSTEDQSNDNSVYSYFIDELTNQVVKDLQSLKGYSETQAYNTLYSGGLKIYTTQDAALQQIVDEEYSNPDNFPADTEYLLDWAYTVTNPSGEEVNYSKEMFQLYFQNADPEFDLLFSSPEEGQSYIDQYKAAILSDGSTEVAETSSFTPQPQSSMTVMDQSNGYVRAIAGGRGEKTASLTLNRATDTTRQPGSTFKIVSTYAPALDAKNMTLATTYTDEKYNYSDGSPVRNSTNSYAGEMTIRKAIQNSVNVVAVKCLTDITPELGYEYLKEFGFTTVLNNQVQDNGEVWSDVYQPMALGGLTLGVTNLELCGAYAAIANGGNYIKPIFYTQIVDRDGNVLIDNTTSGSTRVIKESTAWLLTSAMEDVVKYGTGTELQLDNMPVAGKTGTTDTYNDLWFAGFTPYYTCTVWSGYDNNKNFPNSGVYRSYHKKLWRSVMQRINDGLEYKDFKMPSTVKKATVCSISGLLPRSSCPTVTDYFDVSTIPTLRCTDHSKYKSSGSSSSDNTDSDEEDSNSNSGYSNNRYDNNSDNNSGDNDDEEDTTNKNNNSNNNGDNSGDTGTTPNTNGTENEGGDNTYDPSSEDE